MYRGEELSLVTYLGAHTKCCHCHRLSCQKGLPCFGSIMCNDERGVVMRRCIECEHGNIQPHSQCQAACYQADTQCIFSSQHLILHCISFLRAWQPFSHDRLTVVGIGDITWAFSAMAYILIALYHVLMYFIVFCHVVLWCVTSCHIHCVVENRSEQLQCACKLCTLVPSSCAVHMTSQACVRC